MSTKLVFDFAELRDGMRHLIESVGNTGEASRIVEGSANSAAFDIRSAYAAHRFTGKLQSSVRVEIKSGSRGVLSAIVKATAPHAHLFEFGTVARHYITVLGKRKELGRMPPFHIFIPRMMKWRRRMYMELSALLTRHGLLVSGDAERAA